MQDALNRYHCQMALPGFGVQGQLSLQKARVLIVGAGGLGCPVGQYLAAAGIGRIAIADDDTVSLTNLHRQILFTPQDIGQSKALIACKRLQEQNPDIQIQSLPIRVDVDNIMELLADYDLVVDGTDNFETKYLLNDACVISKKPLVFGAIYRYEGQVAVLNVQMEDGRYSPNYRDIFPAANSAAGTNCAEGGVLPPLAGIVGCLQASEVIKYFTDKSALLVGQLLMINLKNGSIYPIALKKDDSIQITHLNSPMNIDTIDFDQVIKGDYQLVDVRSFKEHAAFNIGGELLPLNSFGAYVDALMGELSSDKPIVCYCATGKRSKEAAILLKEAYPELKVYSLKHGIQHLMEGQS